MNDQRTASSRDIVVIGAGVGGLIAAIELASAGRHVTICERGLEPGGKLRRQWIDGHSIDVGPTVFTLAGVFESVLADAGYELARELDLEPVDILARHDWPNDTQLDLFADFERSVAAIGEFAGAAEAKAYRRFCHDSRRAFELLDAPFLRATRPTPGSLARDNGVRGMLDLARINPFRRLWSKLGLYFRDPRLRQLFGRYATYTGSDPFQATATLMLIAHVEQAGVWRIAGGLYRLAETLARIAVELGVDCRYGAEVATIDTTNGRASGVTLTTGESITARHVVCNADAPAVADGRLGPNAAPAVRVDTRQREGLSGVTWALRARTSGFALSHHNVFFGGDYEAEFRDIFEHQRLPADPTVYVCAQNRGAHDILSPGTAESLLCLANAPLVAANGVSPAFDLKAYRQRVFERLNRAGLEIESDPRHEIVTGPSDFASLFPGSNGALYGQAAHGWRAPFARPGARTRLRGLYLAGGSVHPGAGLPMAALSGRHAAACILDDGGYR